MHQPGSSICLSTNPTIKRRQQIDRQLALKVTKGSLREGYFCRHSFAFIVITVLRVFPEDEASNLLVQLLYRTVCPDCCLFLVTPSCVTEKEWAKKLRLTLGTIHLVWVSLADRRKGAYGVSQIGNQDFHLLHLLGHIISAR